MTDDVKYTNNPGSMGTPFADTKVRATASTEAGHEGYEVQHVRFDDGAGNHTQAVSGPLTDTQLRAAAVPVSIASLPLPSGAATSDNQTNGNQIAQVKFIDTAGNPQGVSIENGTITIRSYLQAIGEGDISGHTAWEKIGFTPTMTTAESVVWSKAGAYVFPAAGGIQMAVASDSATVDLAAGAGCQQVTIGYLDANYAEQSETVTLNASAGTTKVNTVATNILRVNSFRVTRAGANGKPTGNISLTNTGGTVTYSYITAGYTRARNSNYCVPAGKTLYIVQATMGYACAANQVNYGRMYIRANQNNGALVAGIFYPFAEMLAANTAVPILFESPIKLVQKVDLYVGGIASASGVATSVLRGWTE
jgi:hypothetical protein